MCHNNPTPHESIAISILEATTSQSSQSRARLIPRTLLVYVVTVPVVPEDERYLFLGGSCVDVADQLDLYFRKAGSIRTLALSQWRAPTQTQQHSNVSFYLLSYSSHGIDDDDDNQFVACFLANGETFCGWNNNETKDNVAIVVVVVGTARRQGGESESTQSPGSPDRLASFGCG